MNLNDAIRLSSILEATIRNSTVSLYQESDGYGYAVEGEARRICTAGGLQVPPTADVLDMWLEVRDFNGNTHQWPLRELIDGIESGHFSTHAIHGG